MRRQLFIDISELVESPIATGIQRVVRMLIHNWPRHLGAQLVYYAPDLHELIAVPNSIVSLISGPPPISEAGLTKLRTQIQNLKNSRRTPIVLDFHSTVLIPELFYDHKRVRFYEETVRVGLSRILLIVHDIKPLTAPYAFNLNTEAVNAIMPFFSFFTKAHGHCYTNDTVRDEVHGRMERGRPRRRDDTIIVPGADALRIEPQRYSASKTDLLCIGSFEGKKLQERIYAAFRQVRLKQIRRLVFLGARPSRRVEQLEELLTCRDADVLIVDRPSDEHLARYMRCAIGTIFVSPNEGFGLPPIESLHIGVPVIAYEGVPSIRDKAIRGVLRIDEPTVGKIAEGLLQFDQAETCRKLWAEAATNRFGTWSDFAQKVACWASFPAAQREGEEGACESGMPQQRPRDYSGSMTCAA